MHIKNIHCIIEKLSEVAKCEIEKGIENVDTKEMGEVADIIKDLSEAEYYAKISKAMGESEYGKDYDENGAYDEPRYYRGQPRDSRGRYMRRGYEMTPEMYHMYPAEHYRDMDREHGRMYYTETGSNTSGGGLMGGTTSGSSRMYSEMGRDRREGRSGQSRRTYMESKEMGKEKGEKMKELENYTKELAEDITEMIHDATPEEKAMLKNKMQVLMQKF